MNVDFNDLIKLLNFDDKNQLIHTKDNQKLGNIFMNLKNMQKTPEWDINLKLNIYTGLHLSIK